MYVVVERRVGGGLPSGRCSVRVKVRWTRSASGEGQLKRSEIFSGGSAAPARAVSASASAIRTRATLTPIPRGSYSIHPGQSAGTWLARPAATQPKGGDDAGRRDPRALRRRGVERGRAVRIRARSRGGRRTARCG